MRFLVELAILILVQLYYQFIIMARDLRNFNMIDCFRRYC